MSDAKQAYETPTLALMGSFEAMTQGGTAGSRFDGNFTQGDPVPMSPEGKPLIFS